MTIINANYYLEQLLAPAALERMHIPTHGDRSITFMPITQ